MNKPFQPKQVHKLPISTGALPGSAKVMVAAPESSGIKVPVREISLSNAAIMMKRHRAEFVRYAMYTLVGGYALFVVIMACSQLVAGRSAGGMAGSALVDGAFLTFAVALPAFVAGSLVFGALAARRGRGGPTPVDA